MSLVTRGMAAGPGVVTAGGRPTVHLGPRCCDRRWQTHCAPGAQPPRWPSGKASASRAEDPRLLIPLAPGFFRGRVIPVTQKMVLQWLPCQAPGVIGSTLGLVGPVSVYCDWVREVESLICNFYTLVCCWDVKQQTNKPGPVTWRPTTVK